MAKLIHTMVRVLDEARSIDFYDKAFGLTVADRFDFESFTIVYLRNAGADHELELIVNKGRTDPYAHGDGYGHVAFVVDDLESERDRFEKLGLAPEPVKEIQSSDGLRARFFFVNDPDGYRIELLQRQGRFR